MNIEEKINELQEQIKNHNDMMSKQIIELQKLLSKNKNDKAQIKEKSLHELIIGERVKSKDYYTMDSYKQDINIYSDDFTHVDDRLYRNFNYFYDKNEADRYLRLAYLNTKMIRVRNHLNNGWYPINDDDYYTISLYTDDKEDYVVSYSNESISPLFFRTQELTEEFLKLVDIKEMIEYLQLMEGYTPNA